MILRGPTRHSATISIIHSFGEKFIDPMNFWLIESMNNKNLLFYYFLMSCYAFFKRWLPLGQLVKNFWTYSIDPLTLNIYLGSLANGLGCFPFDLEPSRPRSVCIKSF